MTGCVRRARPREARPVAHHLLTVQSDCGVFMMVSMFWPSGGRSLLGHYDRLKILKKKYDPENLFRQNSNINPD
jgi:hypothetical protein